MLRVVVMPIIMVMVIVMHFPGMSIGQPMARLVMRSHNAPTQRGRGEGRQHHDKHNAGDKASGSDQHESILGEAIRFGEKMLGSICPGWATILRGRPR